MTGLAKATTSGVLWSWTGTVGMGVLNNLVVLAVLARLLDPADFGLMGMATIVSGFMMLWLDLGVGPAVIQREKVSQEELSSLFFLNVLMGVLLCLATMALSEVGARVFGAPTVALLLRVVALGFVAGALGQLPHTLLQKQMRWGVITRVQLAAQVVYGFAAITLAYLGWGPLSLGWAVVARQMTSSVLMIVVLGWRPQPRLRLQEARPFLSFGMYLTGGNVVNYLSANADYLVVGRLLGSQALGYYTLAYRLMSFPLAKVSRVVASVTYPALCTLHDQDERLRKAYLKVVRYVALVTFPMLTGMFVVAPEFVQLVYGPKWGESVPLLRLFCLVGMSKSVGTLVGNVYLVKGKPQWGLWWNVAYTVTLLIALLLGVRFGTRGVVTAILALTLPSLVVTQYLVNLLIGTSFRQYFWNLRHAICGSALILVCVGMFQLGPLKPSGLWSSLALSAMAGALVYVAYVYIGERHAFKEGIFLARQIARGIRGAPVAATGEVGSP